MMKWGILSGAFSSFIIACGCLHFIPAYPSTLLPAADLEAFAEEWFIAKRRVEKLRGAGLTRETSGAARIRGAERGQAFINDCAEKPYSFRRPFGLAGFLRMR